MKEVMKTLRKLEKNQFKPANTQLKLTLWRPSRFMKFPWWYLNDLEKEYKIQLPNEYKILMREFGTFYLESVNTKLYRQICFFQHDRSRKSSTHFLNNQIEQKTIFPFASNGGGLEYFYEINNTAGKDSSAIFFGKPGKPYWKDYVFESNSLSEMLNAFLAGSY